MSLNKLLLLEMASRQVLYHFTQIDNITDILDNNVIEKGHQGVVSLTRNHQLEDFGIVRLSLNHEALKSKYRITPYMYGSNTQDFNHVGLDDMENIVDKSPESMEYIRTKFGQEREERIKDKIYPLSRYLIQIDILGTIPFAKKVFNDIEREYKYKLNIPINLVNKWSPVKL
jgi:hypothetical protein